MIASRATLYRVLTIALLTWFAFGFILLNRDSPYDLALALLPPSIHHPFGFDPYGRDLLGVVLRASGLSALFAAAATGVSCLIGVILGTTTALSPHRTRFLFLRGLDLSLAFPSLLLALMWAAIHGPGWSTLIVSLAIGTLPPFTRLIYVRTRELMNEDYVMAARALGAPTHLIVRNHLVRALLSLVGVKLPGMFAHALLAEATLSFLGIGAPIGRDTWGALLAQGKDYLIETPHLAIGTGLPMVCTVLALQLLTESRSQRHLRSA